MNTQEQREQVEFSAARAISAVIALNTESTDLIKLNIDEVIEVTGIIQKGLDGLGVKLNKLCLEHQARREESMVCRR